MVLNLILLPFEVVYILFLPGFVVSLVFFPWKKIDIIERIALSFGFSIAIVPLLVFYTNLIGVKITKTSVIVNVFEIIIISTIMLLVRRWRRGV